MKPNLIPITSHEIPFSPKKTSQSNPCHLQKNPMTSHSLVGFISSIGGFLPHQSIKPTTPTTSKPSTPQESGHPLLRHWPGAQKKENFASFNRYFWWSFMKLYGVLLGFTQRFVHFYWVLSSLKVYGVVWGHALKILKSTKALCSVDSRIRGAFVTT